MRHFTQIFSANPIMINENVNLNLTQYNLEDLISPKQLCAILKCWTNSDRYSVEKWILKKAMEGLAGYLGDHLRLSVQVKLEDGTREEIKLFIKCIPNYNQPKVDFLKSNMFYKREQFVVNELLKDAGGYEEPTPWRPKVYICNEEIIVMPDMSVQSYIMRDKMLYFDLEHCLLTLTALAKYHAASVNYETRKAKIFGDSYRIIDEFPDVMVECNWFDNPWLRAGAKATASILGIMSKKYNTSSVYYKNIECNLGDKYAEACNSIRAYDETVNVVIHKDLWSNNVMFKYAAGKPVNAIILDFQCVRYAPPSFDVTSFLYLTTSRSFREAHEQQVLQHYYQIFIRELTINSASRLKGYYFDKFIEDIERSRAYGLLVPVMIFPYVIMDALSGKKYFDNPETYDQYNNVDRTDIVINHAKKDRVYRDKILEVSEEFVEKFVL